MLRRLPALLLTAVALTGCAANSLNTDAFSHPRKLALVSVLGTVDGLATSADDDAQMLGGVVTTSITELDRSHYLNLVPESSVLNSKSFKAIKDQGAGMFGELAKGYKRFEPKDETANLKQLAKELQVDGFVGVAVHYGTAKDGLAVGGLLRAPIPLSVGRVKAKVNYTVYAFDAKGVVFWQDTAELTSEDGITTAMGVGQYKALHPMLTTLTKAACKQVVARLDERVAGK